MNHSERSLVPLCFGPDVLCDQEVVQACSNHVEHNQAQCEVKKEKQVFFLDNKPGDQKIDGKVGDDDIQGKFNQVRFERIPVVVVNTPKTKKIENEINDPKKKMKPDGNSEF